MMHMKESNVGEETKKRVLEVVKEMYAGNRTLPFYNTLKNEKGEPVIGFESLTMNFIEM